MRALTRLAALTTTALIAGPGCSTVERGAARPSGPQFRCQPTAEDEAALAAIHVDFSAGRAAAAVARSEEAVSHADPAAPLHQLLRLNRVELLFHVGDHAAYLASAEPAIAAARDCDEPRTVSAALREHARAAASKIDASSPLPDQSAAQRYLAEADVITMDPRLSERDRAVVLWLESRIALPIDRKRGVELADAAAASLATAAPDEGVLQVSIVDQQLRAYVQSVSYADYRREQVLTLLSGIPRWVSDTELPVGFPAVDAARARSLALLVAALHDDVKGRMWTAGISTAAAAEYPRPYHAVAVCGHEVAERTRRIGDKPYDWLGAGVRICDELSARANALLPAAATAWEARLDPRDKRAQPLKSLSAKLVANTRVGMIRDLVHLAANAKGSEDPIVRVQALSLIEDLAPMVPNAGLFLDTVSLSLRVGANAEAGECESANSLASVLASRISSWTNVIAGLPADLHSFALDDIHKLANQAMDIANLACGNIARLGSRYLSPPPGDASRVHCSNPWDKPLSDKDRTLAEQGRAVYDELPDPMSAPAPAGAHAARLSDAIRRAGIALLPCSNLHEESLRNLRSILADPDFRALPTSARFNACSLAAKILVGTSRAAELPPLTSGCRVLDDPAHWPPHGPNEVANAFAASSDPAALLRAYADVASRDALMIASVMSVQRWILPRSAVDVITEAVLDATHGHLSDTDGAALGTILMHLQGFEGDIIRATWTASAARNAVQTLEQTTARDQAAYVAAYVSRGADAPETKTIAGRLWAAQLGHFAAIGGASILSIPPDARFVDLCRKDRFVVAYFRAHGDLHALVLDGQCHTRHHHLVSESQLATLTSRYADRLLSAAMFPDLGLAELEANGRELHRLLWEPLAIPAGNRVEVVDISSTAAVHLDTLTGPSGRFLAEDHALVRVAALRELRSRSDSTRGKGALHVGRIPGADLSDDIGIGAASTLVFQLRGSLATKTGLRDRLTIAPPRYLSITAHGKYEPSLPSTMEVAPSQLWLDSSIRLTDGRMSALELMSLPLADTEVVLMSACESGLGPVQAEGSATLRQALRLAGARAVVSSSEVTNDEAAVDVSSRMWRAIARGDDVVTALARAQRERLAALRGGWTTYIAPPRWAVFEVSTFQR